MRDTEGKKYVQRTILDAVWASRDPKVRLFRVLFVVEAAAIWAGLTIFGVQWPVALAITGAFFVWGGWFLPKWMVETIAEAGVEKDATAPDRRDHVDKQLSKWGGSFTSRLYISLAVVALHPFMLPILLMKAFNLLLAALVSALELFLGRK